MGANLAIEAFWKLQPDIGVCLGRWHELHERNIVVEGTGALEKMPGLPIVALLIQSDLKKIQHTSVRSF